MIEGIYVLQQWWIDGAIHVPPQVDGRFVLREGCVLAFLHNRTDALPRYSGTLAGRYELGADTFAYGYDDALMVYQSADGPGVGEQVPWSGMREFKVVAEDGAVCIRSHAGTEEFRFSGAGFIYSENGQPLRQWRRLNGTA